MTAKDLLRKPTLSEYTRAEFLALVERISDPHAGTDEEDGDFVSHFNEIVPHPSGSDLLFWPEEGADNSSEGVVTEIERYCRENGLPSFKDA
ncbi:bacteriocin immunity protein [Paracoccus alkanivorans]|uniref:Bacteriocin immunity protein n=1 Tax=Paracoccus alkanivorans TaxID=2116655 RepID=A0A3M0MFS3_9RHOB|nr:bacteriocin immunity protein [Paracoccus alkanivorans]RMC34440.1 bacteriocin immunity protein [Paracoccus alkanivorans]